ncbi:hypothetical protein PIB30_025659, partial [Stylosanthes scabra]|nr:hypothetical protein [Stylosanthes scabra]
MCRKIEENSERREFRVLHVILIQGSSEFSECFTSPLIQREFRVRSRVLQVTSYIKFRVLQITSTREFRFIRALHAIRIQREFRVLSECFKATSTRVSEYFTPSSFLEGVPSFSPSAASHLIHRVPSSPSTSNHLNLSARRTRNSL